MLAQIKSHPLKKIPHIEVRENNKQAIFIYKLNMPLYNI